MTHVISHSQKNIAGFYINHRHQCKR